MNSSFFNNNDGNNSFSGTQVLSQQGGGFMNSSFASDMAGGENTTSGTGQSRVGVPNEASLLPCTIKQIQSAPLPAKDDSFRIDGKEVHNATIVGRIVHINVESTHTSYTIDDGTGQIDVRVWTTVNESKNNNENDNSNDNGNNNNKDEDENSGFEMNMYVRCIGKIKVYQENINFNGYKMRKIIDHNEITYHNLEAIFAHLVNQDPIKARNVLSQNKPNPVNQSRNTINNNNNNNNNNMNNNRMGNSNSNSNNNGNNNGGMSGMNNNMNNMSMNNGNGNNNDGGNMMIEEDNRERSPLEIAILQFLRRSEDANEKNSSYDGCHVDKILAAFDDNQRNEIRELLDHMSSDGTIYSTVDDEHFRTSQ